MSARTATADTLIAAGDRLHALARRIDPPDYGVKIVWDDDYEIAGATAWGEPEDSDYAGETRAKLGTGEWVVVGVVALERDRRTGVVRETDVPSSLWGIVTSSTDLPAGQTFGPVFELDELSGYLRTVADEIIAEARQ